MSDIWWSHNGESFIAHSAIEAADYGELEVGAIVYYGESVAFQPRVCADWLIDHLQEQAWDFCGEYSEGWLDNVSDEAKHELESMVVAWVMRQEKPDFYRIENVKEHVLTPEDLCEETEMTTNTDELLARSAPTTNATSRAVILAPNPRRRRR